MKKILFLVIGVMLNGWIFSASENFQADKEAIERAHETLTSVRKNFRKTLEKAIAEKGIPGSIGDCQIKAPLLGKVSEEVEIGRTSQKLRNQNNEPRPWVKPILEEYQKVPPTQQAKNRLVRLGPDHYGYVEPIYIEAVCLNCHGANLQSEVKKEISRLYPKDQATGFKLGDFRGLIWLESRTK